MRCVCTRTRLHAPLQFLTAFDSALTFTYTHPHPERLTGLHLKVHKDTGNEPISSFSVCVFRDPSEQ